MNGLDAHALWHIAHALVLGLAWCVPLVGLGIRQDEETAEHATQSPLATGIRLVADDEL